MPTMLTRPSKPHERLDGTPPDLWRFSVEQYHEMIRIGIIGEDDPVELLEGCLVTKMPQNPPHRITNRLVRIALERILPAGWFVDSHNPVTTEDSEPEPDVMVVRGAIRDYSARHPGPEDSALIVEVADATLQRDRTLKKRIYARAKVAVYWIVNLAERKIEVYTAPANTRRGPDYRHRRDYSEKESVPVVLDGREVGHITVRDVLP